MRLRAKLCCLSNSALYEGYLASISFVDLLDASFHLTVRLRSQLRRTTLLYQTHELDSGFCKTPIPIVGNIVNITPMCGFETKYQVADVPKVIVQLSLHEL
jgi:hypothetical protein